MFALVPKWNILELSKAGTFAAELSFSCASGDYWLPSPPRCKRRCAVLPAREARLGGGSRPRAAIFVCPTPPGAHLLCPFSGTSSSALLPTWAAYALPTLMLPPRSPSRAPSSSSGPARNGPSSASPTCPSCVPARSRPSRSRDGRAGAGFSACFSSCTGLHLLAKTAGGL